MASSVAEDLEENPYGVTEVFNPPDAVVDIVLVHGLTGHPHRTWNTDDHRVFWPLDLLPTNVKKARILVYGYDADVASFKGGTSKDKIHNHAETLVQRLSANRSLEDATERPIIFICHSLGGLVVKRALGYSVNVTNPNLEQQRSIYVSTFGIIFLGTPHHGSDLARWGSLLQSIASIAPKRILDTSPQLVEALKSQSETLQNINRYFEQIMDRFHMLFCHEGKPTDVKGTRQFIVDEESAAPGFAIGERMVIEADHSHMCKFATKRSPGYEGVAEAVKRYAMEAPDTIQRRWLDEKDARGHVLQARAFEMMPRNVVNSMGGSPYTGNTSTAGNSTTSLPWKEPGSLTISQPTEVVSIDPQLAEPPFVAPPTFRPNSLFYGMELELQELNRRLFNAKKRDMGTACVLLWCPPGGGKTHLARQYVFTHKKDFPGGIFWIDAKLRGDRFQGFWQVAQGAAMKGVQDPRQNKDKETAATFVDTVKKWFEARQDWLLVFDGITFDKDEDVTEFQKFIPDSKNSSIIYTSVDRTLVRKQRLLYPIAVKVRPLSEVDAMDLLYKGLGIRQPTVEQDEKARVLVRHLECLPLAIHAMAHRLSATRKAIEKYHIESYSTDFKLAEPYMGIMADLRKNNHPEALNLIHLLCFFGHNVPVAMLNLGRQVLKDANIYIKSSDRGSKRDVETTIGTLIKYGLIDRSLIRYDRIDRSTPDLSDGRQGSQDSVVSTLETIDIIKIHTIVQGFCCDSLREEGQFIYWLEIAVKVFCHSFDRADAHIRKQPTLGLVKDYREYETHGQRLLSHFAEKLAKTSSLRQTRTRLQRNLLRIEQEIQKRSPGSSQLSFRPQASIFDRTPSTSDDMPDTPRSTLSRVSTLGLGFEKPPVDSPVSIDGHCDQVVVASGDSEPQHTPEYPEDAGYATDQGELCASYPMTPTRSEDTARPHTTTDDDNGSGWQLVSNTRKFSKSKLSRSGQSGTGSIKRPRPRKDLGSFHPSVARTLVNTTPAVGSTSRPRSETRGRTLRSSEAINSLITIHHASPPPSREKENVPPRRLLSRPRASQTQTQVHINQPVLHEEGADQLLAEQDFFRDPPSAYSNAFPIVEDMQRGRSQESLRSRAGNAGRSPLAAEFVPQTRETQSASNEADPFSPPSGITSNHQTPKSSPGFVYANPRHSSDPYIAGPPPVLTVNEHDGAWSFFQPTAGRNPAPLPFEGGVSITAKRRLPADFRGHQPSGTYQPPRGPSTPRYLPQQAYQPPIYYSAPLPPGYSSQPMSRNPSGQSSQYPETEPPLFPSPFSPYLGAASTPMSPRDRLPDGCSPRKSPKVAHAFPAYYHHHDIFEPHLTHTGIDPRFTAENAIAGMGTWAAAEPISPLTPNANQYDISMSRSSSGPGIAIEGSGANTGPGIAQFQQAQGQLRFGQHEPFNIDEARQRTLEHARNLQLMAFEQGAFRPPHRDHRDRRSRWDYHLSTAAAVDTSTGTGTGTGPGLGLGLELTTGLTTAQPYPELNLIPTPSDELALQMQEFVSMSGEGRRRGLSAPMGRPDLDLDLNLSAGAYGVEFEGQG